MSPEWSSPIAILKGPIDRKLWLVTVVTIVAIAGVGILVARSQPSHTPSPIGLRLAAAAAVTVFAAAAKVLVGPRAAGRDGCGGDPGRRRPAHRLRIDVRASPVTLARS